MPALIDLHTHSHCSDGTLSPAALVAAAAARGVQVLALTDHDSTAGLAEARTACHAAGIAFVTGVEITALWRGQEIHVVGLGFDPGEPQLVAHLAQIVGQRRERITAMGEKLRRVPKLAALDLAAQVLREAPVPTRTHLARALVDAGLADTLQAAFDRYLGRGARGYVPAAWPALEQAVQAIRSAGGHAVLAHPHRYRLSGGALRNLCAEFAAAGGAALEVSLPGLGPNDADRLARLAREHALAGSAGSDFHDPGQPWRPLGRFAKLPEGVEPLLPRLALAA
ncbi:MAG: PHP domain-containing protein [Steroidobacteraceae bacterium]